MKSIFVFNFSLANDDRNESKSRQLNHSQDSYSNTKINKIAEFISSFIKFEFRERIEIAVECVWPFGLVGFQLGKFTNSDSFNRNASLIFSAAVIFMVHNNRIKNHFRRRQPEERQKKYKSFQFFVVVAVACGDGRCGRQPHRCDSTQ